MAKASRSKISQHPARAEIERELALGVPLQTIADTYGVSVAAAHRHKKKLPEQLRAGLIGNFMKPGEDLEKLRVQESGGLLGRLGYYRAQLLLLLDTAKAARQLQIASNIVGNLQRNEELIGKYLQLFGTHHTQMNISLLVHPEYLRLRNIVTEALAPYPEARRLVAEAIRRMESDAARKMAEAALPDVKLIEGNATVAPEAVS